VPPERLHASLWLMMASDFSMRAKWRALKSGWRSAPQKVLDRGNIVRDGRKTLGPYRKCPGVKGRSRAPQRDAGALSIRAFEGSRWHQGCVGAQVMGFECW